MGGGSRRCFSQLRNGACTAKSGKRERERAATDLLRRKEPGNRVSGGGGRDEYVRFARAYIDDREL